MPLTALPLLLAACMAPGATTRAAAPSQVATDAEVVSGSPGHHVGGKGGTSRAQRAGGPPIFMADAGAAVAWVDGQPVSRRMFSHFQKRMRSSVLREFAPSALDPGFWHRPAGGRIPGEVLKHRALAECTRVCVQLRLAQEQGLIQKPDFDAILDELPMENQRRARAMEAGQVVHGPARFSEETYFAHRFSSLQIQIKEALGQRQLAPSPQDLRLAYERMRTRTRPLEEVEPALRLQLIDRAYGAMVDQRVRRASVRQNAKAWKAIPVE